MHFPLRAKENGDFLFSSKMNFKDCNATRSIKSGPSIHERYNLEIFSFFWLLQRGVMMPILRCVS